MSLIQQSNRGSRGRRGIYNLLWLAAFIAFVSGTVLVWFFGEGILEPSRESEVVKVFRLASPAVVSLSAKPSFDLPDLGIWSRRRLPWAEEFFRRYFGERREDDLNLGSGIIVDPRGYILTNEHVVNNAAWIQVTLADGRTAEGEVWGAEPYLDLAVVKVEIKGDLPYLEMGASKDIMIGEQVIVIGNPLGLGHTCTTGIVSSLNRTVVVDNRHYRNLVQIDAAVNPGNSGGPLLNIRGDLVGITTALNPEAEGIGFATPIDHARKVVEDLIRYRYIPTAWLGISVENLERDRGSTGIDRGGVFISRVKEGGPAHGLLEAGDVIRSWEGRRIRGVDDFVSLARQLRVGGQVVLSCVCEGSLRKVEFEARAFPEELAEEWAWRHMGIKVEEGGPDTGPEEGRPSRRSGVFIREVAPNSPAHAWGLSPGDLILRLNREEIESWNDFQRAVVRLRNREHVFILFKRGHFTPLYANIPFSASGEVW